VPKRWGIRPFLREHAAELTAVAGILAADRISKLAAHKYLAAKSGVQLWPFFHLTYLENTGTIFGLLNGTNVFFILFTLGVLSFLAWNWRELALQRNGRAALTLISAGALGNLYDRIFQGYVIDFLDFRVWPVFNIADTCICAGAALLALGLLHPAKNNDKREEEGG